MQNKAEVSLGGGAALYKALERKLFADLAAPDQNHRYQLLRQITRFYRAAHALKIAGVGDDLKAFAFKRLPPILKEQTVNHDSIVRDAADTLREVVSPRDGIAFLLDRVEDEPDWLRYTNQDAWNQYGPRLAEWRTEVKDLGDLEPRLLKVVLTELRRDLRTRESRSRYIYARGHSYYWKEKEADFAKAAEEVLAERKASSASVEYVAEYLFYGLPREKRAIEILFAAHEQKVLAESGRWQLADFLHRQERHAESIPLLLALMELRPDTLHYRTKLMHAYFRTGKQAELMALLDADRQVLPREGPVGRERAGVARVQHPGEPALRAVGEVLQGTHPTAPAQRTRAAGSATVRCRTTTRTRRKPTPGWAKRRKPSTWRAGQW